MLVVTRRRNESVVVGEDIEITIAQIQGGKVRLGISAPWWVPIKRKEIYHVTQSKEMLVK
jgi:carbon storage regulator